MHRRFQTVSNVASGIWPSVGRIGSKFVPNFGRSTLNFGNENSNILSNYGFHGNKFPNIYMGLMSGSNHQFPSLELGLSSR